MFPHTQEACVTLFRCNFLCNLSCAVWDMIDDKWWMRCKILQWITSAATYYTFSIRIAMRDDWWWWIVDNGWDVRYCRRSFSAATYCTIQYYYTDSNWFRLSPGCPRPSIASQVQNRGLKHHSCFRLKRFFPENNNWPHSLRVIFMFLSCPSASNLHHTENGWSEADRRIRLLGMEIRSCLYHI